MKVFYSLTDADLAKELTHGAVGVLPTDTVYGLVCNASLPDAVQELFSIKRRESKPGTVLAASTQQLIDLGLKARYLRAVESFWPNPVSIIIPCGEELAYLHMGRDSIAVRIPSDPDLTDLLRHTGPLLTTSANHPNHPTAHNFLEAQEYFGETVDFYVDAGDKSDGQASTIIRIVDDAIQVIRQGAVRIDDAGRITRVDD